MEMEQPKMNTQELIATAKALVADDKGLLAMDESNPTCNKRFAALGSPSQKFVRRAVSVTRKITAENSWFFNSGNAQV